MSEEDIYKSLMGSSIIFLHGNISEDSTHTLIAKLMWLEKNRPREAIKLYINSIGGVIAQGLAIYDTIQTLRTPVSTICLGQASSMATVLLTAGKPGERYSLPHSKIMIHQPNHPGVSGTETEMQIQVTQMKEFRLTIEELISKHTGQPIEKVHQDCERDYYMNAQEALKYGIVDKIITKYLLPPIDT